MFRAATPGGRLMSDTRGPRRTADDIMASAALVDLRLSDSDAEEVAELLSAWMPAAIALSTRMQAVQELLPALTFNTMAGLASKGVSRWPE